MIYAAADIRKSHRLPLERVLMVNTIPKDARNQGSMNLGLEIAREYLDADSVQWWEDVDTGQYSHIAFNVFYPMLLFNMGAFITKHRIPPEKILIGGQGVGDGRSTEVIGDVFIGEIDYHENSTHITSSPRIGEQIGYIELSRGCKYRCTFCEYTWAHINNREKPIELLEEQIRYVRYRGCKRVNFLSANFGGFSKVGELLEICAQNGVKVMNTDTVLHDIKKLKDYRHLLPSSIKVGIESFDPETRKRVGKNFSDSKMEEVITTSIENGVSYFHFYMIYGLPNDDYSKWFDWLGRLAEIRKRYSRTEADLFGREYQLHTKPLRFEFNITNFEPGHETPLAEAQEVDFQKKAEFLIEWFAALKRHGFHTGDTERDYKNARGRIGRKELSYKMLMRLKKGGEDVSEAILRCFPRGIGRSVSDREAERFLEMVGS